MCFLKKQGDLEKLRKLRKDKVIYEPYSILIFSLVHFFSSSLKVFKLWRFLILGGRWFQVEADLTMNDLLDVDFSTTFVFFLKVTNFARSLLVFLLKRCSYFARIYTKLSPYEEFSILI